MTDIMERLREAAKMPKEKFMVDVALNEAADEIERLRGELEPLQKALETHAHYAAEIERLRKALREIAELNSVGGDAAYMMDVARRALGEAKGK